MKKIEFSTSKGEWLLVDGAGEDFAMDMVHRVISNEWFINLRHITEEQASEVVDIPTADGFYPKYGNYEGGNKWYIYKKSIESLHSLIKSKGWHLFDNPLGTRAFNCGSGDWEEAEAKTFYNPYLFKKI